MIHNDDGNPLADTTAWTNDSGYDFLDVTVDLLPYAGQNLLFRFRSGSWVDDVVVTFGEQCFIITSSHTLTPMPLYRG